MTASDAAALRAGAARLAIEVGRDALSRIDRFVTLLCEWNQRIRLTGERGPAVIIRRHVVDSLAVVPHLPASGLVIDVGSGGGFPGIVLGCMRPDLDLVLIDSRRRTVSFLREAIRSIPLPRALAEALRAEEAAAAPELAGRAARVVSRGLRLDVFLRAAARLVSATGQVIAMQTPRISTAGAATAAAAHHLRVIGTTEYVLPDGTVRKLVCFAR